MFSLIIIIGDIESPAGAKMKTPGGRRPSGGFYSAWSYSSMSWGSVRGIEV